MSSPEPFDTPPTQEEIDAAQRLGVGVNLYRQFKRNAGAAGELLEKGEGPADIVAEERLHEKMRREPGLFKQRNQAPSIFASAARTPGEVAKTLLTLFCYVVLMCLIVIFFPEKVQRTPGIFQVIGLGLLLIPAMMLSSFIWERIGEGARDLVRALVRFWPLTLVGLLFLLGLAKFFFGSSVVQAS